MANNEPQATAKTRFIDSFDEFTKECNGRREFPLQQTRQEAIARFGELSFPTTRHEDWKYTNITPILRCEFTRTKEVPAVDVENVKNCMLDDATASLVFVNGRFAAELSMLPKQAPGIVISDLATALQHDKSLIDEHLTRYASYEDQVFTALNTAFAEDGAFIYLPDGTVLTQPIQLLYLTTTSATPFFANPRHLFVAGANSQAYVVESYHSLAEQLCFYNTVTEATLAANAHLTHVRLQQHGKKTHHITRQQIHQQNHSNYTSINIDLGGAIIRNDSNVVLDATNCEAHLYGLYLGDREQLIDNHTCIDHAKPHCLSNELYKGILADKARGVFNGKVMVRKDAQKTQAYQSNQNILLSDEACIDTKPQLEIFADDVKCSHGATIGEVDEEAVFYLRSRGIGEREAHALIRHAFACEVLHNITHRSTYERVEKAVVAKL